jgi:hypothetical protein
VDIIDFDVEIAPTIQDDNSRRRFDNHVWFLLNAALLYAFHSDCETGSPQCALLDRLSILLLTPYRGGSDPYLRPSLQGEAWEAHSSALYSGLPSNSLSLNLDSQEFLILAVKYGLVAYVGEKLIHQLSGHPIESSYGSMLQFIPKFPRIARASPSVNYPPPRYKMVELFLHHGGDPNAQYNGPSDLERVLYDVAQFGGRSSNREHERDYLRIVSLLIKYGASPLTKIQSSSEQDRATDIHSAQRSALQVLESARSIFPEEVDSLLQALRNRNHPRREDRRRDRKRWERRERIDNDYASCRRRR